MNDYLYIIIIIGLTIFILFYGGHNYQNKIEYETRYFDNLNSIILFENKLQHFQNCIDFSSYDYYNINEIVNLSNNIIPNFIDCFYIKINPYSIFKINNIINKYDTNNMIMIIFNIYNYKNIELIIGNDTNFNGNYGYFYELKKKISIVGIYDIYNNSDQIIYIACFFAKKPFWHY